MRFNKKKEEIHLIIGQKQNQRIYQLVFFLIQNTKRFGIKNIVKSTVI